ncbi:MAG: hypothetical protein FWC41_11365 [Firmicutes bacterium]|nr:hypothetical protein [Bacillota bacterium]
MEYPIQINYKYTNNMFRAKQWLDDLPDLFAADFEITSRFTQKEKELFKVRLKFEKDRHKRILLHQYINSDGFSHPSLTQITHFSVAWNDRDSYCIILDNVGITSLILNFLVETEKTQLWHNLVFDAKHIFYYTDKIPKKYIDTQLLAKSLLNNANALKDKTGLKELMEYAYGAWALQKENFILEEQWNTNMIKYSATDPCATYKLYMDIQEELGKWTI